MVTVTGLEHRRLFNHALGSRPFRDAGLYERIGGQPAVGRLVDLLYEGIAGDDQLRPLFPRDLAASRSMQKLFFAEWLDGPRRYSARAYKGLGASHDGLPITPALAGRWLEHFRRSLEATVAAENDRTAIFAEVRALAMALVQPARDPEPARDPGKQTRERPVASGLVRQGRAYRDAVEGSCPPW